MKYFVLLLGLCLTFASTNLQAQEEEYGLASYYSDDFQGRSTAYGETYDKDQLTCAHKRYPYGTMLRVTRLDTKKSVNVKVTDKGPFIKGRVVDLSRRAAEILGMLGDGAVEVKVERISGGSTRTADVAPAPEPAPTRRAETPVSYEETRPTRTADVATSEPTPTPAPSRAAVVEKPVQEEQVAPLPEPAPAPTPAASKPRETQATATPKPERNALVGEDYSPYGLYKIVLEKPGDNANYGVQVASFTSYENVLQKVADLQAKWFDNILVSVEPGEGGVNNYKVILGPFADQKTAQHYQDSLRRRYKINGFVLDLSSLSY